MQNRPREGPPYPNGIPNRWVVPTTTSTSYSGASKRVKLNKSAATIVLILCVFASQLQRVDQLFRLNFQVLK